MTARRLTAALAMVVALAWGSAQAARAQDDGRGSVSCTIAFVVDGDSFNCRDGTKVRLLLVNAPVNWQIDYVVVQPERPEPVREETPRAAPPADVPPTAEAAADREPPAKFGPGGGSSEIVYLQVGAFTSATRAADLSKRLKADGFNSTVQIAVVEGRGFYRVRVGPFRVSADAQRIDRDRRRLTGLGYPVEQVPGGP